LGLKRLQKKICKENQSPFDIKHFFPIMLCTRQYKKYNKVREAKEIVDLKIWHYTVVIYMLDNFGKNRNTQSDLWSDDENHETMQQINYYDLFSSLTALCLHSRP
jgi:hypothetical protein